MRLRSRLRNAWLALNGFPKSRFISEMSIELTADTSKLERDLDRAKAKLDLLLPMVQALDLPAPRLMFQTDRKLSPTAMQNLRESFDRWATDGKAMVIEDGLKVSQLVAGQWIPVEMSELQADPAHVVPPTS